MDNVVSTTDALGRGEGDIACARKAREGGMRCKHSETLRWNPVGIQSHPVELGQQPEASLASWWGDPPGEA